MNEKVKTEEEVIRNWYLRNLANFITYIGLISTIGIPVIALIDSKRLWLMVGLACFSALSDLLDGGIAKILKTTSLFGALFDRLRDKVFVVPNLIILISVYRWALKDLPFWLLASTITLVFSIIFLELLLLIAGWIIMMKKVPVEPKKWAKAKTDCLFAVIILWLISLAIQTFFKIPVFQFSIYFINIILVIAGFLAVLSIDKYYQEYIKGPG